MRTALRLLVALVLTLAGAPPAVAAEPADPSHVVDTFVPDGATDPSLRALHGSYTGFGAVATGGEGRPLLTVTSLADHGIGTLRNALEAAALLGGARIDFAVAGDVVPLAELVVPANTTIDGLAASAPGITLWGEHLTPGGGVLEIHASNIVVRGLRIRNAVNDGIQIAAKHGVAIAGIVVDHCSVTNSGDGGIDVTGGEGALVSEVTLSWNYLAANGGPCAGKEWCGGGSLVKYGVTRISVHANVWDKNLRRNPSIDGTDVAGGTLADLRGNVVAGYLESGTQLRNGARGNVVGNVFAGERPLLIAGASVFAAANSGATAPSIALPFDVLDPLEAVPPELIAAAAGAPPRDAIDAAYRDALATYEDAKNAVVGPTSGDPSAGLAVTTLPLDAVTLAEVRQRVRTARTARARGDRALARAEYTAVLVLLADARGLYARPAEALAAMAALALADLARGDRPTARAHAVSAVEHARRSGDAALARRARHRLDRLSR